MPSARPPIGTVETSPSGPEHARRRMARARGAHDAGGGVDGQAGHGHERPSRELTERNLVRLRQEVGRIRVQADERPERELGEGHVGRGRDSVAARVPQHDRELPVRQREEVVDVASDLDPRRGLVDGTDLEAIDVRNPARQQRALHRVCEVLPFLGEPCVLDGERGLPGDEERRLHLLVAEAPRGVERDDRERREELGRGRDRDDEGGRALLEERDEKLVRGAELAGGRGIEHERLAHAEQPPAGKFLDRLLALEDRPERRREAFVGEMRRMRDELVAALTLHADHGRVRVEQVDRRARHGFERRVEREALRERPRDFVQRAQLLRGFALGRERLLPFRGESLRALVELGVLRRDRQLAGQRREQRQLVRLELAAEGEVHREQPDDLFTRNERQGKDRFDLGLDDGVPDGREVQIGLRVGDVEHALGPERPEGELEQALGHGELGGGVSAGFVAQAVPVAEVDRHPLHAQQLGHACDRGVDRVRERKLGDRLADDREQGARSFELERRPASSLSGPERLSGTHGEGAESVRDRLAKAPRRDRRRAGGLRPPAVRASGWRSYGRSRRRSARAAAARARAGRRTPGRGAAASAWVGPAEAINSIGSSSLGCHRSAASAPDGPAGHASDLFRPAASVERGSERVPGEQKRAVRATGSVAGGECSEHEPDLRGSDLGGRLVSGPERLSRAQQLDARDWPAFRSDRDEQGLGTRVRGEPPSRRPPEAPLASRRGQGAPRSRSSTPRARRRAPRSR